MRSLTFLFGTRESLARWENEGGARAAPPNVIGRKPKSGPDPFDDPTTHGDFDKGIVDRHTLGIMQISLAVLIAAFAGMVIFWSY